MNWAEEKKNLKKIEICENANCNSSPHFIVSFSSSLSAYQMQGFGSASFFADPDPGKNLHADSDPGGIRGVKGKNDFF